MSNDAKVWIVGLILMGIFALLVYDNTTNPLPHDYHDTHPEYRERYGK